MKIFLSATCFMWTWYSSGCVWEACTRMWMDLKIITPLKTCPRTNPSPTHGFDPPLSAPAQHPGRRGGGRGSCPRHRRRRWRATPCRRTPAGCALSSASGSRDLQVHNVRSVLSDTQQLQSANGGHHLLQASQHFTSYLFSTNLDHTGPSFSFQFLFSLNATAQRMKENHALVMRYERDADGSEDGGDVLVEDELTIAAVSPQLVSQFAERNEWVVVPVHAVEPQLVVELTVPRVARADGKQTTRRTVIQTKRHLHTTV